jgi:sarcosine oxidase subunit alpha
MTVDGEPGVRTCVTPCRDGIEVVREGGWPSTDRDVLSVNDKLRLLLPVGFYHKTFIHPRFAWGVAERVIRRTTGIGSLPMDLRVGRAVSRHARCHVLVVGGGVAGLDAALHANGSVIVAEERTIGDGVAPGRHLDRIRELEASVRADPTVTVLEEHVAIGIYDGPMVPLVSRDEVVQVHPERVVIATGATEVHPVFPGNDLPGIWLGRGAARMAGVHGVRPGEVAIVATSTEEGLEHLRTLQRAGVRIRAALVPEALGDRLPDDIEAIADGTVEEARGRGRVETVVVRKGNRVRRLACDALVLSVGLSPRDELARMSVVEPVEVVGDAALVADGPAFGSDGSVCLCEDVAVHDLEQAWAEGYRSSEILKRYTTATMGMCRGAMCGRALSRFVQERAGEPSAEVAGRTTARPPVRGVSVETLASTVHEVIEKRTGLHRTHVARGARLGRSGSWIRPFSYGDWREEYLAVRQRVSVMDVGTLGKFLIAGRDAGRLVDAMFACRTADLAPGRSRYALALDEAGYVMDDGLLCALEDGRWFLTSTSGGAPRMDARLRDVADRMGLHVHVLDRTAELGAIIVAGPRARDLLERLSDDAVDGTAIAYPGHGRIAVAGIPCRAIRTGFVGELAFELHHPRTRGPELWDALVAEGRALDLRPHGLDALELLRLEKGHVFLGQDTLPDDTPAKLRLSWAVAMDKGWFVGRTALARMAALPVGRRLVGLEFDAVADRASSLRGEPLVLDDRVVGRVTSAERSGVLDRDIGLGWLRTTDGASPQTLRTGNGVAARVVPTPFYDPEGVRVRG